MGDADSQEIAQELAALRDLIESHDYAYYVLDDPKVPDAEYDRLMRRLYQIEDAYPCCFTDYSGTDLTDYGLPFGSVYSDYFGFIVKFPAD